MTSALTLTFAVVALIVALLSGGLAYVAWRKAESLTKRRPLDSAIPPDLDALRDEVELLRADAGQVLRHLAVVRYDAFGDMGGQMSWSIALLDDAGDGVVLTSIHGRSDSRTYAKNVAAWTCDQQLSPEEEDAITGARP